MDISTFLCKCCLSDSFKCISHTWRFVLSRYVWQNLKKQADLCFSSFLSVLPQPGQTKCAEGNVWFFCCCCSFVFCFFISRFCTNPRIRFGNCIFFPVLTRWPKLLTATCVQIHSLISQCYDFNWSETGKPFHLEKSATPDYKKNIFIVDLSKPTVLNSSTLTDFSFTYNIHKENKWSILLIRFQAHLQYFFILKPRAVCISN